MFTPSDEDGQRVTSEIAVIQFCGEHDRIREQRCPSVRERTFMNTTSISLLQRLGDAPGADDWKQLVDDYVPMVKRWLRQNGAADSDADDIVQEVMTVLVNRVGEFQRQRTGSFRRWVRTITINCMRDHLRKRKRSPQPTGGSDMVQILSGARG